MESTDQTNSINPPNRPRITLTIPPYYPNQPFYIPQTAGLQSPGIQTAGIPPELVAAGYGNPFASMYPHKATEFMFKQFSGFRDFTMNTAKSGLSVGEKSAFWIYNRFSNWSRKWFTHIFLFLVVLCYSIAGASLFVAVEGTYEEKLVGDIRRARYNLVSKLRNMANDKELLSNPEQWEGSAIHEMGDFETILYASYKKGFVDSNKKIWSFWNSMFYCGTIYTTIDSRQIWKVLKQEHTDELKCFKLLKNKCFVDFIIFIIYCGIGGMMFKFIEGSFENIYKCGVKRVKRDFVDHLWLSSHNLREEDWKSLARTKLRKFEEELQVALEAGVTSYSNQKAWTFLNSVSYCMTVVTTIGYGHISPSTNSGRAITIIYAFFGIPLFLILLADFGKLFTRGIKFVWAFVRRVYYTGSCRKVRKTAQVQEVMRGINMVYDIAMFRRPSTITREEMNNVNNDLTQIPTKVPESRFSPNMPGQAQAPLASFSPSLPPMTPRSQPSSAMPSNLDTPTTPAPEVFEIDDEFNLPITVALVVFVLYIIIGAIVYSMWEEWSFFESFYFVFISMSTIGLGDYVPKHPIYMMLSIVYLIFGLALTSMCINVVQLKLSDHFRQASAKIGATIGLKMAEEEAARNSQLQTPVDLASVHTTTPQVYGQNQRFDFTHPPNLPPRLPSQVSPPVSAKNSDSNTSVKKKKSDKIKKAKK